MNGGKEIGDSLGRNKTAQFSLTECLSNYLTQWKRSQNITNISETRCTTALGHDMMPGHPTKPSRSLTWWEWRTGQQMAPEAEDGAVRAGRKVAMGHWGKTSAPIKQKWDPMQRVGVWQRGCLNPSQRKWAVGLAADGNTTSQQWSITFHSQCQY